MLCLWHTANSADGLNLKALAHAFSQFDENLGTRAVPSGADGLFHKKKHRDSIIHGQIVTRWSKEFPCDGIIAVNDKAASNDVLKAAYKAASGKKTFVWTLDAFEKKSQKVLDSDTQYFLITKNPIDMCKILVDQGFKCGIDTVIVGPCNDREGAVKLGNNQSITQEEADAFEKIAQAGYKIKFALLPDVSIGTWDDFKSKFGY